MQTIEQYLEEVSSAARAVDTGVLEQAITALAGAYEERRALYLIGNGGSAANASHFGQDLSKGTLGVDVAKRFRVFSLVDCSPIVTAVANDIGYDTVFEFQLRQFAEPGDWLVAVSGSGNSPNIVKACRYARENGTRVMGFTGFDGGQLGQLSDIHVHVPLKHMCQTEAVHSILMHLIVDILKERLAAPPGC